MAASRRNAFRVVKILERYGDRIQIRHVDRKGGLLNIQASSPPGFGHTTRGRTALAKVLIQKRLRRAKNFMAQMGPPRRG